MRSHGRTGTGGEAGASAGMAEYEGTTGRQDAGSGAQAVREQREGQAERSGAGQEGKQGQKRRRRREAEGEEGGWRRCVVGEYAVGAVRRVGGRRVVKLAEVMAGGRRTEKRRRSSAHAAAAVATRNAFGYTEGGKSVASSEQTNSGWSEDEEGRQMVIREYATRRQVVTESRRGYTVGAAWDEGNMIQAMARLKNPTITWCNQKRIHRGRKISGKFRAGK